MGGFSSKKAVSVEDYYVFGKELGQGSFATVFQATRRSDNRKSRSKDLAIPNAVAIKRITKKDIAPSDHHRLAEEVAILRLVDNDGCVRFFESFDGPTYLCLVLELMSGGELFDYVLERKRLTESEAAHIIKAVGSALDYLHSNSIVHRDIKPENLVFESATTLRPKLTDFGLAKKLEGGPDSNELSEPCGTPGYVAPEILSYGEYGSKVDVWSLGVILYILLSGYPPFYDEDQHELFMQIKRGDYDFADPSWETVSREAKEAIAAMLTVNPSLRVSAKDLLDIDWVKNPSKASKEELGDHVVRGIEVVKSKLNFNKVMLAVKILNAFKPKKPGFAAKLLEKSKEASSKGKDGMPSSSAIQEVDAPEESKPEETAIPAE